MDPLQWMGAIRMRVQTADKKHQSNPQLAHSTPVHQLTSSFFVVFKSFFILFLSINIFWSENLRICKKPTHH